MDTAITVDKDFQFLLPKLGASELADLESDILANGIRNPLVLWGDILIDGYNRFHIAQKHNIPVETVSMEFGSRDEAIIWIIRSQVARRNLTPYQLRYFRGLHYQAERRLVTNIEGVNQHSEVDRQNGGQPQPHSTSKVLADKYNVSQRTIERDSRLADALIALGEVSPEAKQSILSGETRVTRKELDAILAGSEGLAAEIADDINNGTFGERRRESTAGDIPAGDGSEGVSLDQAFQRIANLMQKELSILLKTYAPSAVKTALRTHITELEEVYGQL